THALHSEYANLIPDQLRQNLFCKTPVMSIHYVQRHLHGVEPEAVPRGNFQHVEMNSWILMTGESNEAEFSSLLRFHQRSIRTFGIEYSMRIFESENFVV